MSKTTLFLYAGLMMAFVMLSYAFVDPNLIYLKWMYSGIAFSHRFFVTAVYVILLVSFFIFYLYFIKKASKRKLAIKQGRILIAISCILIFSHHTILSYDLF